MLKLSSLRARLDCLTKPSDISHLTKFLQLQLHQTIKSNRCLLLVYRLFLSALNLMGQTVAYYLLFKIVYDITLWHTRTMDILQYWK